MRGHTIKAIAAADGSTALYTVGVCGSLGESVMYPMLEAYGSELFAREVPNEKANAVANLMNFLVSRMKAGHAIKDEQLCQSRGLLMVIMLHSEASVEVLRDDFHLELPVTSSLIELCPLIDADDPEEWGRVPTTAEYQTMADTVLAAQEGMVELIFDFEGIDVEGM